MKKTLLIGLVTLLSFSGCAMTQQRNAIIASSKQNTFKGLDKNTKFSISVPSKHDGAYDDIEQFKFNIDSGLYQGKNATAIMVKLQNSQTWKVLTLMVQVDGEWVKLSKNKQ